MANRYRGSMYVGVTADIAARVSARREGRGSAHVCENDLHQLVWAEHTPMIEDAIAHEKRLKRWRRQWKFELIEKGNPDWTDLFGTLNS